MAKLPVVTARQVIRALRKAGFYRARTSSAHHIFKHPEDSKLRPVVPVHSSKTIPPGTLRSIIKQAGLTVGEFRDLL